MPKLSHIVAFAGLAAAVVACAPREPEPIVPEPVYNKYGEAIAECRPREQQLSSVYLPDLPICEELCKEVDRPQVNTNVPGVPPFICPPLPPQYEGGNGGQPGRQLPGAAP